jgi:hypothetical protein
MPKKKPTGNKIDLILDVFEEKTISLNEGAIPITPFVAFAAFKRQALNALRRNKAIKTAKAIKEVPKKARAKAAIGVEKARATVGAQSGSTIYKLTDEQMKEMGRIYNKYGKELSKEIISFRRNVLAPYQLIKRKISSSSRVSSKDITGLSKEEFNSATESGRKKIQSRGSEFFKKSQQIQDDLGGLASQVKNLQVMKKDFKDGDAKIDYNIANKVFREFGVGDENLEGYSREELKQVYNDIMKNYRALTKVASEAKMGNVEFQKTKDLVKKSRKLWQGKTIDLTKAEKDKFYTRGSFDTALGKYFFSKDIIRQLTQPGTINIFKNTYLSIIDEMIKKSGKRRENALQKLISLRKGAQLTDKEKKVWDKLPTSKSFSGNMEDYFQKIKGEDFLDKPITIKRSPELIDAERKIENEIRRFERKLKNIIDESDYNSLKRMRLIGNLISISELRDPKTLFKSANELSSKSSSGESEEKDPDKTSAQKKENYLSPEQFKRRIKEIATVEYDKVSELDNAKKEALALADRMKKQGDEDAVADHADILRKIERRRTTEAKKLSGHKLDPELKIDIADIENLAKEILQKEYTSSDRLKLDNQRVKSMIEKYKKVEPKADEELEDIEFLFNRITRKIATMKDKLN